MQSPVCESKALQIIGTQICLSKHRVVKVEGPLDLHVRRIFRIEIRKLSYNLITPARLVDGNERSMDREI